MFIIQLIILIYILFMIYHIVTIQKYNYNGYIIETSDLLQLSENLQKLNPILFQKNILNLSFDEMIKDKGYYSINSENYTFKLSTFTNEDDIYIYKDKQIINDMNLIQNIQLNYEQLPLKEINLMKYYAITFLKGKHQITLKSAVHNYNIIGIIHGESTFHLFNPKHSREINDKENKKIKKWGHKKLVKEGDILFIPPYWKYIQETNDKTIQIHIDIDNIFTLIPNFFKDY